MKKYKSINQVLKRGQVELNVISTLIIIIGMSLIVFLSGLLLPKPFIGIGIGTGIILPITLAWLWWGYKVVKWRVWAFEHTKKEDWDSLKQRAIIQGLIWRDGSVFEKSKFRSRKEEQKIQFVNAEIARINENRTAEDLLLNKVIDDPDVPSEIKFLYTKSESILSLILPIVFIGIGIFLISDDHLIFGIISIVNAFNITDLNKIKNNWKKETQFIISEEGIYARKIKQFGLVNWADTQDIVCDPENGILEMQVWDKEELYDITIDLKDFYSGDYDELLRKINIFMHRNDLSSGNNSKK